MSDIDEWRQYWNTGGVHGRRESPKIAAHCRDTLLSYLRNELPARVVALTEVEYANDKRADIGVFMGVIYETTQHPESVTWPTR